MYLEQLSPEQRLNLAKSATIVFFPESWRKNIVYIQAPLELIGFKKDDPRAEFQIVLKDGNFENGLPLGFVSLSDFVLSFCNNMLRVSQRRKVISATDFYPPIKDSEETGKISFDTSPEEDRQSDQAKRTYREQMSELFPTYKKDVEKNDLQIKNILLRNGIKVK